MRVVLYTLIASLLCFYTPTGVDLVFQDDSAYAAVKRPPPPPPKPKPKIQRAKPKAKANLKPAAKRNPLKKKAAASTKLKPNFKLPKGKKVNLKPQSLRAFKNTKNIKNKLLSRYAPGNKPLRVAHPSKLKNALSKFRGKNYHVAGNTFKLTKNGMKHILERHHPKYWNGSGIRKQNQSFFSHKTSVKQVESAINSVMKQNHSKLAKIGSRGVGSVTGTHKGVTYVLGVNKGQIGQFYPK